jgi:predicted protein tyrosine phosphatase
MLALGMFTVCSKSQVHQRVKEVDATHLITMLDPDDHIYKPSTIPIENHLFLKFEDCEFPDNPRAPRIEHCQRILDFGAKFPSDSITVVHCFAGLCRSTTAALALWLQRNGATDLAGARAWLAEDRPQAMPNLLMAKHFDQLLNLNGQFLDLCKRINDERVALIRSGPD